MKTLGYLVVLLCCVTAVSEAACSAAQLATELNTDPASLGYAPYLAQSRDADVVSILNTVQAGTAYVVSKGLVSTDSQRGVWGDLITFVSLMEAGNTKTKWTTIIDKLLLPFATLDYTDAFTAGYFAEMVTDGLLVSDGQGGSRPVTTDDITARTTRQGSRAEVVCGPNTILTNRDVSLALRGEG